jgi:ribosomal-protein-alanine N-acetyltransferase
MENQQSTGRVESDIRQELETIDVEFRSMRLEDIPQILEVEHESFTVPWTAEAFRNELTHNRHAHYFVMLHQGEIIGYAGMWLIFDEAHITNVAIRKRFRGKKLGHRLMRHLIDKAAVLGAEKMTLEVRVSNYVAQRLYSRYGFRPVGVRKGYYSDNQEDALIMWADISDTVSF